MIAKIYHHKKAVLAFLLALVMVAALIPFTATEAQAVEIAPTAEDAEGFTESFTLVLANADDPEKTETHQVTYAEGTGWSTIKSSILPAHAFAYKGSTVTDISYTDKWNYTVNLQLDQSDATKLSNADVMIATGDAVSDSPLNLHFEHCYAKVTFNVTLASEFNSETDVISGFHVVTRDGDNVTPYVNGNSYTAVIPEGSYVGTGVHFALLYIGGKMFEVAIPDKYAYLNGSLVAGKHYTFDLKVGKNKVELTPTNRDADYPGGWESEANLDGTIGTIGTADKGKTAWENEDKVYQHLYSDKYGNQTATLTFNAADGTWTSNGTLKYLENETPAVTAVYAPGCEIASDNTIGLRGGQQYGMAEYIEANTDIGNDGALAVSFSSGRAYSRLRIVAAPNETLTVTTTGFTPAGPNGATVPESYTLTADANGNACLYGTFAEGGSITVKNGTIELVTHTFTAATEKSMSYALAARVASVQIGNETKYYSTIAEAFTAVAGETAQIRLLHDTDFSSQISVTGDVTFDLNGHTASFKGDSTAIAFFVQKDANVTIQDSSAAQSGYITSGSATAVYAANASLKLVSGRVDCVNVNESSFEMTGGTVEKGINSNSAAVTISGGTVHGSTDGVKSSVMVNGGTTTIKDTAVLDGEYLAVWKSGKLNLSAYSDCENKVIYIASAVENIYTDITLPDGYAFYRNGTALGDESSAAIDDTLTINNAPVGAYPEG